MAQGPPIAARLVAQANLVTAQVRLDHRRPLPTARRRRPSRCGVAGGGDRRPRGTAAQFTCSPAALSLILSRAPLKNQSAPGPPVSVLALPSSWTVVPKTNIASMGPTPALIFAIRVVKGSA